VNVMDMGLVDRRGRDHGGGALNFTVSIARISFGVFVRGVKRYLPSKESCGYAHHFINGLWYVVIQLFNQVRVGDAVHESRYPHAFWCSADMYAFCFEPFHESFRWLSYPLLDMTDFHGDLLWPNLVNTVVFTGLLRRVGLFPLRRSLENTLAVCEECVPLDAVTGLCFLLFGFFILLYDSDSEN
ncbi:hypothetical protein Tco_0493544, partial [Tanacetum coccineum]